MEKSVQIRNGLPSDGVKSVLEMLHEITANGSRRECSRQSILNSKNESAVDLNIDRMINARIIELVNRDGEIYYRVSESIFSSVYRRSPLNDRLSKSTWSISQ